MLGLIFGDMIAMPFEARNVRGTDAFKSTEFELFQPDSRFSDTTVMAIAVADCLLHNKPYMETLQMWGLRYANAGFGGSFFRWLHDPHPHPYLSWSNGSAMRAPAIGWARDGDALLMEAKRSADVSHNHAEGIKGAQAVAWAVYMGRTGASAGEMRKDLAHRFEYDLYRTTGMIRPHYKFETTCALSVPQALLCAIEASSVEEAVRLAVSLGGDASTQAGIAGAIAEARFGFPTEYKDEVLSRLPRDIKDVVVEFRDRYLPDA